MGVNVSLWVGNDNSWTLLGHVISAENGSFSLQITLTQTPGEYYIKVQTEETDNFLSAEALEDLEVLPASVELFLQLIFDNETIVLGDLEAYNWEEGQNIWIDGYLIFRESEADYIMTLAIKNLMTNETSPFLTPYFWNLGSGEFSIHISFTGSDLFLPADITCYVTITGEVPAEPTRNSFDIVDWIPDVLGTASISVLSLKRRKR
jgi:hypothetical protein